MKKFIVFLGVLIALGWIAIWQYQFLLTQYARLFTVHNATKGADALVVLSGGMVLRFTYAIELYQQKYAPLILLTEEREMVFSPKSKRMIGVAKDKRRTAEEIEEEMGVKVNWDIVPSLKNGATSTFDEAYDFLHYNRQHHFKRIIIVTDTFHTRRALYAFEKVLEGSGIQVQSMGAPNPIFNETNWWLADVGISAYVLEGIKYLVYRFTKRNVTFVKNY